MRLYLAGVPFADSHQGFLYGFQFFLRVCLDDDGHCHIKEPLVILPHIIHDLLDLLFLRPLVVGNIGREIVVLVPYPLLADDVALYSHILLL